MRVTGEENKLPDASMEPAVNVVFMVLLWIVFMFSCVGSFIALGNPYTSVAPLCAVVSLVGLALLYKK